MEKIEPRVVVWQSLWTERHEGAVLELLELGRRSARGTITGHDDEAGPFRIEYEVGWDERWRTAGVNLAVVRGDGQRRLRLAQRNGVWRASTGDEGEVDGPGEPDEPDEPDGPDGPRATHGRGEELGFLRGCVDGDIWPTPFTNTLPIRRLGLAVGERREIDVALIDGVDATVTRASQAYTRLDRSVFRFESVGSDFVADLTVDPTGLVLDYPGLFTRLGDRD